MRTDRGRRITFPPRVAARSTSRPTPPTRRRAVGNRHVDPNSFGRHDNGRLRAPHLHGNEARPRRRQTATPPPQTLRYDPVPASELRPALAARVPCGQYLACLPLCPLPPRRDQL